MPNIIKLHKEHADFETTFKKIVSILKLYPKVFVSTLSKLGSIQTMMINGEVVLEDGVLITFNKSKNKHKISTTADVYAKPTDYHIHQIATNHSVKGATKKVLDKFVKLCKSNGGSNIYLTVRQENERACKFYNEYGFEIVAENYWKSKVEYCTGNGDFDNDAYYYKKIKGYIYKLQLENNKASKFYNI